MSIDRNRLQRPPGRARPPHVESSDEFLVRHGLLDAPGPRTEIGPGWPGPPGRPLPPPPGAAPPGWSATPGRPMTQRDEPPRPPGGRRRAEQGPPPAAPPAPGRPPVPPPPVGYRPPANGQPVRRRAPEAPPPPGYGPGPTGRGRPPAGPGADRPWTNGGRPRPADPRNAPVRDPRTNGRQRPTPPPAPPRRPAGPPATGRPRLDPPTAPALDRDDVRPKPAEHDTPDSHLEVPPSASTPSPEPAPDRPRRRRAADEPVDEPAADGEPGDDEPADEQPRRRTGRRAADTGERPVGTSGTGRSVARARAAARTAKVPARTEEAPEARTTKTRRRPPADETSDERLRADRIDETLTRLTAAHAGLVLGAHDVTDEDDEDGEDGEDETDGAPRRERTAVRAGRVAVAAVAFLLVLAAGLGWAGRTRLDGALTQVAAVDVAADGVVDAAAQTGDENVLVLAIDSGGSAGATTRANTVAVVHRDARGDRSVAVTLPPQLEITRPPCERWDPAAAAYLGQTVPAEPRTTFDSAYAVGGPRCATRAAQQVTGLAITRFVAVDLAATSALVEVVGGVQVCVERPVLDSVLGPVAADAGTDEYNGARAATLVRAADVRDEPAGGAALVQRQQRVLAAALERALSPAALLNPGRVGGVAPALGTTVVSTDTGVADLLALSSGLGEVRAVPVEPRPNSRNNVELRETEARELFAAVRTGAALPAPDATAVSSGPADVTADVLNASGRDGLAAEVAGTLGDLGFRTAEVRNAGQPALDTVVRFSPDRADQAQLLAAAVPSATAVPDPGTSGVLQLVLGRSFDGTVRASAGPEPAVDPPAPVAPTATCG